VKAKEKLPSTTQSKQSVCGPNNAKRHSVLSSKNHKGAAKHFRASLL